jgi:hypothetical protein
MPEVEAQEIQGAQDEASEVRAAPDDAAQEAG